jgi:hypothetical protein
MRILLLITFALLTKVCPGQDSTTAIYINEVVQKIESRLSTDIMEKKDTSIFDDGDTLQRGAFLTIHTEFYTDPQTMLLDKIVEKSLYKKMSTEITIYFLGNQPVRLTNRQWEGGDVRFDFDIYYMSDKPVYVAKRNNLKGSPDADMFLKWCHQLRNQYQQIVQEYNQTFVRARLKSRKT